MRCIIDEQVLEASVSDWSPDEGTNTMKNVPINRQCPVAILIRVFYGVLIRPKVFKSNFFKRECLFLMCLILREKAYGKSKRVCPLLLGLVVILFVIYYGEEEVQTLK